MKVDVPDPTGQGGTSTTGPVVQRLFGGELRVLVSLVPEHHQTVFDNLMTNLSCLLSAFSSNREVDTVVYKKLVKDVYTDILRKITSPTGGPWIHSSWLLKPFSRDYRRER